MSTEVPINENIKSDGLTLYNRGRIHMAKCEYKKAYDCFVESAQKEYYLSDFWLYILCNSSYYKMLNQEEASKRLNLVQKPFKTNEHYEYIEFIAMYYKYFDGPLILAYLQQNKIINAIFSYNTEKCYVEYNQNLKNKPDIFFYQFRGEFHLIKKKYFEARCDFSIAIKKNNKFIQALFGYAKCQRYVKTYDSLVAHSYFENIIQECPADHEIHYEWGMLCFHEESYQEALVHFRNALKFDPNNPIYMEMLQKVESKNMRGFWRMKTPRSLTPVHDSKLRLETAPLSFGAEQINSEEDLFKEKKLGRSFIELSELHDCGENVDPSQQSVSSSELRLSSISSLEQTECKHKFFNEMPSVLSKKHKVTKDTWHVFIACQVGENQKLNWKESATLFLEGFNDQYFLHRYYLIRDQLNHAKIKVEKLRSQDVLFDHSIEGVIQVNQKIEFPIRYYIASNYGYLVGSTIGKELRSREKSDFLFSGSKCFGLTVVPLNHWMWCNSFIRKNIDARGAPPINQLPQSVHYNIPTEDTSFCIVC